MERTVETHIEPENAGARLDLFLAKRFTYRSRNEWQTAVAEGEILLNGEKTKSSRKLAAGDVIRFVPKNIAEPEVDQTYRVLAETSDWIAVDKPGNLPCHPSGIYFEHTLWRLLCERCRAPVHIITRLDRETSGIVLSAKNPEAAAEFTKVMMHSEKVRKRYLALVHGVFGREVRAEGFLSDDPASPVRKKRRFTADRPEGECETAATLLKPLETNGTFSLVEALPETGRLHQIRATLCSLGFPVAGDKLYGVDPMLYLKFAEDALDDSDRAKLILPRQALHACGLSIPFRGKTLEFASPEPECFRALLRKKICKS